MAIISRANISDIIGDRLRFLMTATPKELAEDKRKTDEAMAKAGAEERARYDALSDQEKADYDALTVGMMPRLRR